MGCSPQPRSASPIASATTSASSIQSHPRVGQKVPRAPPGSTPAASTTGQLAETPPQLSPAKGKDKRKKRKRKEDDASPQRPKKPKKRASPVASSDTESYENPTVKKVEAPAGVAPPESSDSQAEGPLPIVAIPRGRRVLPNLRRFPQAVANELLFSCKYFKKSQLYSFQIVFALIKFLIFLSILKEFC